MGPSPLPGQIPDPVPISLPFTLSPPPARDFCPGTHSTPARHVRLVPPLWPRGKEPREPCHGHPPPWVSSRHTRPAPGCLASGMHQCQAWVPLELVSSWHRHLKFSDSTFLSSGCHVPVSPLALFAGYWKSPLWQARGHTCAESLGSGKPRDFCATLWPRGCLGTPWFPLQDWYRGHGRRAGPSIPRSNVSPAAGSRQTQGTLGPSCLSEVHLWAGEPQTLCGGNAEHRTLRRPLGAHNFSASPFTPSSFQTRRRSPARIL